MWEPLFSLNANSGKLEPELAISLTPNAVFDRWTLDLRKDIRWSDKKSFTGDDVIFSVDMANNRRLSLPAIETVTMRKDVKSVKKGADEFTVEFTLNAPNPRFDIENFGGTLSGSFLIMPKHVWKDIMDPRKVPRPWEFNLQPIGTGPYKFKSSTDKQIVWERDDGWWGDTAEGATAPFKPLPRQIIWQVFDDAAASKKALVENELDVARDYTREDFADAQSRNPKIVGWDPASHRAWSDPCPRQLDVNQKHRRDDGTLTPWSDPELRKALSLLIDRTALAQAIYGDTSVPSRTMFTEQSAMEPYIDAVVDAHYGVASSADVAGADALLTSVGYAKSDAFYAKSGQLLSATILVDSDEAQDVKGAEQLVTQLKSKGIDAKVDAVSHDDFWADRVAHGRYELAYSWLSCGSLVEPYTSMSRYVAGKSVAVGDISPGFDNTGRWDSPAAQQYSTVIDEMGHLRPSDPDPVAKKRMLDVTVKAYKYLADEIPLIPLVQAPVFVPFNTAYWTGWPTKGGDTLPLGDWGSIYRMIRELKPQP